MSEVVDPPPGAAPTAAPEVSVVDPAPGENSAAPAIGLIGLAAIAIGLAIRFYFFATGRSPVDGDEGIMGIMAHHVASFEHLPMFFYRQHYMGTIEIPALAALDFIIPKAWRFTAWPLRLTQAAYLVVMMLLSFKLFSKFFGGRIGRWTLFFIAVAPAYWIDYTQRMRHVVFMILLGQIIALLALRAVEHWDEARRIPGRLWLSLGVVIGLAWWHYQLISVFYAGAFALLLARPRMVWSWFARPGSARPDLTTLACLPLVVLPCVTVAGMTMGWGGKHYAWFPHVISAALALAAAGVALACRATRRNVDDPRLAPFLVPLGFLIGFTPAMIYLATLKEEFWVNPLHPELTDILAHVRDLFMMEFSAMVEITRAESRHSNVHVVDARSFVNLILYGLVAVALIRRAIRPEGPRERLGLAFLAAVFGALVALHVLTPRRTLWMEPRFLTPAFVVLAVGLALLTAEFQTALTNSLKSARARVVGSGLFAVAVLIGSFALWGRGWLDQPGEKISWPTGHRAELIEISRALEANNVDTVVFDPITNWVLLGYELQFMSELRQRANRGAMGDRLVGLLDESRYHSSEFLLTIPERANEILKDKPGDDLESKIKQAGGFRAGSLWAFPLPPGYIVRGRQGDPPAN